MIYRPPAGSSHQSRYKVGYEVRPRLDLDQVKSACLDCAKSFCLVCAEERFKAA